MKNQPTVIRIHHLSLDMILNSLFLERECCGSSMSHFQEMPESLPCHLAHLNPISQQYRRQYNTDPCLSCIDKQEVIKSFSKEPLGVS